MVAGLIATSAGAETTYKDHVRPLLRAECMTCHNTDKAKGGLDLSSYETLLQGGSSGEIVAAGDPDGSRLFQVVTHVSEPFMPENASKRPDEELETIKQWIAGGLLKQSGDVAKKPAANRVAMQPVEASIDRPSGPPPMPKNARLEPFVRAARPNAVIALDASPWAPLVAIGGHRQIAIYNDESRELIDIRAFEEGLPTIVRFSRNASVLLAAGGVGAESGSVVLWDVKSGERIAQVGDEYDTVLAADLSPDQRWVALGGSDKRAKVYSVETGELIHKFDKHTDWIMAATFSPDGVLLATGDRSGGLTVWEAESGLEFHDLRGHKDAITEVRWRRDSNVLASASEDGVIKMWDLHKGREIRGWKAHEGGVLDLAFAKNGTLASVGRDGRARIWDGNGKQHREIEGFADLPIRCAFSHDDARLLVGDWTGQVTLWQVADGIRLGELDANPPRLIERVELAARMQNEARQALDATQRKEQDSAEATATLGDELAALEARREEADAQYAAIESQAGEAKARREEADAALAEARKNREALDANVAGLTESMQALEHRLQATRKEWEALRSPAEMKTLSDVATEGPEQTGAPADPIPDEETLTPALEQLEAERAALEHELREADAALEAVRQTEQEREQAAKDAAAAVKAAEDAVAKADAERKQAGDVLPAKRNALNEAEVYATEAAASLAAAQAAYDEREAEHRRWSEASRLHAIREAGIAEDGQFAREVMPILDAHCIQCHGLEKTKGKFRMDRPDLIVKGGKSGKPGMAPGDSDASQLLVRASLPSDDLDIMPPEDDPLTPDEIDTVRRWIEGGGAF